MPSDLAGWLDHIGRNSSSPVMLGLERVREVWERMAISLEGRTVVTVGGTNGKGSCTAFLESILDAAGYRVMRYSSPHIRRYSERVRISGKEADDEMLCSAFSAVERARKASSAVPLTYFEFSTLAALWCAAESDCEALALEVGLGGRLDAVNAVDPDVAVITMVGIDHVDHLGDDRERIGWEKAHIMRPRKPAVIGEKRPPESVGQHARAIGAKMHVLGQDFGYRTAADGSWSYQGIAADCHALPRPALTGTHQIVNAATALAALETLRGRFPLAAAHVREGIQSVRLDGRLQVVPGQPATVLDVAHNPDAARRLADGLLGLGFSPETVAIFGIMADKDIDGVIDAMEGRIDHWLTIPLGTVRGENPQALAERIRAKKASAEACGSTALAGISARRRCGAHGRIVVFGSFLAVSSYLESTENATGIAECR